MSDLEPCPFCGTADTRTVRQGSLWRVWCWSCNAQTGCAETKAEVVAAWNNRANRGPAKRLPAAERERAWQEIEAEVQRLRTKQEAENDVETRSING